MEDPAQLDMELPAVAPVLVPEGLAAAAKKAQAPLTAGRGE